MCLFCEARRQAVLAAIDDEQMPLHDLLGVAQYALVPGEHDGSHSPAGETGRATGDVYR